MQSRRTLLSRLRSLFARTRPEKPQPLRTARKPREPRARGIEPLEGRIAPASLLPGGFGISYTDLDGDHVTVTFSKALLATTPETLLSQIFTFSNGADPVAFDFAGPKLLQLIDLTKTPFTNQDLFIRAADKTSITVNAVKGEGGMGDDLASIGAIRASNIALNHVTIDGDLGQIDAGRAGGGVKSLTVNSLYKLGEATQVSSGTSVDKLESRITGVLGSLEVKTDLYGYVRVTDAFGVFTDAFTAAKIGSVKVGGSLIGKSAVETASDNTGTIESQRSIGHVKILGLNDPNNPTDAAGLVGGGGKNSGSVVAGKGIASVTISDSMTGGGGLNSGSVVARTSIGKISVGHDMVGGAGTGSGSILADTSIANVTISDSMTGGAGTNSGAIVAKTSIARLTVGDDVTGGAGTSSGSIQAASLINARIDGSLEGGVGDGSGSIIASKTITNVTVSENLQGGSGKTSGSISALGGLGRVTVVGDVTGGAGVQSGAVHSGKNLANVSVGGELTGGAGDRSGSIGADGTITRVMAGELVGGGGANSGSILAGVDPALRGMIASAVIENGIAGGLGTASGSIVASKLGSVRVGSASDGAGMQGGDGNFSGVIVSNSTASSVVVHGNVEGGAGDQSGSIQVHGRLAALRVAGNLSGGGGDFSGSIRALEVIGEDFTGTAASIGTVAIAGNITGGAGTSSGLVESTGNLGSLKAASLTGGAGEDSGAIAVGSGFLGAGNAGTIQITGAVTATEGSVDPSITVRGTVTALRVGSLSDATVQVGDSIVRAIVNGSMVNSLITAADLVPNLPLPGGLAIGSLTVKGDVSGSQILAGYDLDGSAVNADASIGAVSVTGDWIASDLVAGVIDVNQDGFGNADDVAINAGTNNVNILARIASIVIHGTVTGTSESGDRFGFTAEKIGSMKVGGSSLGFDSKARNQTIALAGTDDVFAREVVA